MGFCLHGCKYCGASTITLEKEDPRPKNEYENEDPVKQKTVEITSSTHI